MTTPSILRWDPSTRDHRHKGAWVLLVCQLGHYQFLSENEQLLKWRGEVKSPAAKRESSRQEKAETVASRTSKRTWLRARDLHSSADVGSCTIARMLHPGTFARTNVGSAVIAVSCLAALRFSVVASTIGDRSRANRRLSDRSDGGDQQCHTRWSVSASRIIEESEHLK
jgi:hypothetical protein